MKKYIILIILLFFMLNLLTGQIFKKKSEYLLPLTKDEINGHRLWIRITKEENYKEYPSWPGQKGIQAGQAPHGVWHIVYIHPILYNALPIKKRIAPYGSIVIKENLNKNKKLESITVMAKVKGYAPDTNDWFWAKYNKDGTVIAEGKLKPCIECHTPAKDNDYIIVYPLDREIKKRK